MSQLTIMVVDDEMGMRMAVARSLENFAVDMPDIGGAVTFKILQAGSGEEALEILAQTPVDLLLLDHKMPGISGLDVLAQVSAKEMDVLVVMITAYASLETAITATKRGAYDFLAKPFTPDELKAAVRKAAKHLVIQRQARKLAEEKRQVRFQLISVVAHELKAPLGAIEGYLYLLRDRPAGDDWNAYQKAIERSILRLQGMRKLITDLLDLTRIESGQKKRELTQVELRETIQMSIDAVQADANARHIAIQFHDGSPITVWADRGEMEIVFNNLLTNAVKYNRENGRVDVKLSEKAGLITAEVADTGIGMSPEETAKLFGDFVRIKNKKTKDIMGSGLGLSILKKIAQLYHGDVAVKSEPDVGSTFTVTLRSEDAPAPAATPAN
ncbi:MAG: response regulator [Myxococcales bacterium]|nr:response regulator [Myxococcales bacterium]